MLFVIGLTALPILTCSSKWNNNAFIVSIPFDSVSKKPLMLTLDRPRSLTNLNSEQDGGRQEEKPAGQFLHVRLEI